MDTPSIARSLVIVFMIRVWSSLGRVWQCISESISFWLRTCAMLFGERQGGSIWLNVMVWFVSVTEQVEHAPRQDSFTECSIHEGIIYLLINTIYRGDLQIS